MESPCVNICQIDQQLGLCEGCGRSLMEIARWSSMTSQERHAIMLALPGRMKASKAEQDTQFNGA